MMKFTLIVAAVLYLSLGAEAKGRILDGDTDVNNEFRYTVAIQKLIPGSDEFKHACGGAIIDKRYVITAAHCVYGLKPKQLVVRSGYYDEETDVDTTTYHKVIRYMYPKTYFNSSCRAHENDIAILKIARSFDLSDEEKYMKVLLPEYDTDYEFSQVIFSGFGAEKYEIHINKTTNATRNTFKYPDMLRFFSTTVLPLEKCKELLAVSVSDSHICTNNEDASGFSCSGDSGGPLVYDNTIIGIRNRHEECSDYTPELYTRVSSYLDFIQKVLYHKFSYDIVYVP